MDFYNSDEPVTLDIYNDRWEYAQQMAFYIPAGARKAYTVSMGNKKSATNTKPSDMSESEYETLMNEKMDVESFDPDSVSLVFLLT